MGGVGWQALLATASVRQRRYAYSIAIAALLVCWALHAVLYSARFPYDDAYTTLHGAEVLAARSEHAYGTVSPFVGATSPLHLLLVGFLTIFVPGAWALHTAMWLATIAFALGVLRLAFCHRASIIEAFAITLLSLVAAATPLQLLNGLETGWVMAAIVWTLALASDDLKYGRIVAALVGIMPLLRPELAALSPLVLLTQWTRRWNTNQSRRDKLREIAIDLGVLAAVSVPFVLLSWATTGSVTPSTIDAKRAFFAEGCLYPALKRTLVWTSLEHFGHELGVVSFAVVLLLFSSVGRACLLFMLVFVYAYYASFPGALGQSAHRYLYTLLPCLLFGVALCLHHDRRMIRYTARGLLALGLVQGVVHVRTPWLEYRDRVTTRHDRLVRIANETQRLVPRDARVLIHDAGFFSVATELQLVDMVGLKTPSCIGVHARITAPSCGRRRGDAIHEIAMRERATHVIVSHGWDRVFGLSKALESHGWTLEPLVTAFVDYRVYRLKEPSTP